MVWTTEELNKYYNIVIFVKIILFFAGIPYISKYIIEYVFSYYIKRVKKSIVLRQPAEVQKCRIFYIFKCFSETRIRKFYISIFSWFNRGRSLI